MPVDLLTQTADSGARLAIRLLQDAAQRGDIDPWDVDVIPVVDGFLDQLKQRIEIPKKISQHFSQNGGSYEVDLAQSSEAFLAASVLVGLKAEVLEAEMLSVDLEEEDEACFDFGEQGWHANNGVLLNNPKLGFVCTGQTVDGLPGLEGYYIEEDETLPASSRLRFRYGESCPPVNNSDLPLLDSSEWPPERLLKVVRNYSMDYIRNIIPVMSQELGPLVAQGILYRTGRKIGMQYSLETQEILDLQEPIDVLEALLAAQGDTTERVGSNLSQRSWRLMSGLEAECTPEWMDGLLGLWEGVLLPIESRSRLDLLERLDLGQKEFLWKISESGRAKGF